MNQRVLEILLGVKDRKLRRDLRRIEGDVGSFAKRTTHKMRSSFKDAFGTLAGVGTVAGIAAIGKNVLDVDKKMTRLGIQAGQTKAEMIGFHNRLRDLSDDTGLSTDSLADAASKFVSLTGAYDQANRGAEVFAKTAAASGTSLEHVGAAAASLKNNLGITDVAGFEKGLSIMLAQGKAGAVELREMASLLPTIAPMFAKFGKSGVEGLADLGAALQVARQGFGSGSQAATGMVAAMVALQRNSAKLKKAGVNIYEKDGKTLHNFLDIIHDISKAKKLASQEQLLGVLGDTGAVRFVSELASKMSQVDRQVAGGLASNAVMGDFATYMESNAGRIEKAWQRLQNTLARELTPERLTVLVEAFEALGRAAGGVTIGQPATGLRAGNGITEHAFALAEDAGQTLRAPTIDIADLGQAVAIVLVLRTTSGAPTAARNILGKRENSPHNGFEIALLANGVPFVRCDAGAQHASSMPTANIADDAWHTLAFTYKPVARNFQLATELAAGVALLTPGNCTSSVHLALGDARIPGAAVEVALLAICTGPSVEIVSAAELADVIHNAIVEEP